MSEHPVTKLLREAYDDYNKVDDEACRFNIEDNPPRIVEIFKQLNKLTQDRYYGTGLFVPENVKGCRILDIGCGSGSFVFILSKLVGPDGFVVGIDVSEGLIESANKVIDYHTKLWGYDKPNVEFRLANAEKLLESGFKDFDFIVSNSCWCMLPDQQTAFNQAWNLLKFGGQFCINDVYARFRLSEELKNDQWLAANGTTLSMTYEELAPMTAKEGFTTPYLTQAYPVGKKREEVWKKLKDAEFCCASSRLFKLPPGAKRGAAIVTYLGNIEDYPETFKWDVDLVFKKGEKVKVDGELAAILANTSFKDNFTIEDFPGSVTTNRNQNPWVRLDQLRQTGKLPEPIYYL